MSLKTVLLASIRTFHFPLSYIHLIRSPRARELHGYLQIVHHEPLSARPPNSVTS